MPLETPEGASYHPDLCTLRNRPYSGTTSRRYLTYEQRATLARESMRPAPEIEIPSLEVVQAAAELIYQTWPGRT
jgi:hypothetical protein